uniref:Uncharacterized protein n=1 Tax=Anguilla anguilla TaxID=7936 RepID=A0A0E9W7K3_ANGAN
MFCDCEQSHGRQVLQSVFYLTGRSKYDLPLQQGLLMLLPSFLGTKGKRGGVSVTYFIPIWGTLQFCL